jgi:hypothetical protein
MRSERSRHFGRFAIVIAAILCAIIANTMGCELGSNCENGICETDVICGDGGCGPLDGGVSHGGG